MKNTLIIITIFLLVGLTAFVGYKHYTTKKEDTSNNSTETSKEVSYVIVDINPSVELAVDSNNNVVDVESLDDDGDIVTSDLNLVGKNVEDASEDIANAAAQTGYLDDLSDNNTVVVTSSSDNETARTNIEQKVIDKLNTYFENTKLSALVAAKGLDDNLKTEADQYGISYGKMMLVECALAFNPSLNKDDLVKMSIQDINKTIKDYVKNRHADMKQKRQDAIKTWQQEKKTKIAAFKLKQQQERETLWNSVKDTYKNATPAEKKQIMSNLVAQRKTQIKTDLDSLKQELKQEQQDIKQSLNNYRDTNYNYPVLKSIYQKAEQKIQERKNKNQQ